MRELFRGLRVSLYVDPVQDWLREAYDCLEIADGTLETSSAQLITDLALRRLWALPIDSSALTKELTSAARGLKDWSGHTDIIAKIEKLLSVEMHATFLEHPLHALSTNALAITHLVRSDLCESFKLNSKGLRGPNDRVLSHLNLREELNARKKERTVKSLAWQAFSQKASEVRLYAWPNLYYQYNFYEPHIWLWYLSQAHVVMPVSYPRSLRPYLWRNTRADWARAQSTSLYREIYQESRLLDSETKEVCTEEDPPMLRPQKWGAQDAHANARVKFTVGRQRFERLASSAYVWNAKAGTLTPLSNFLGAPPRSATLVFKLTKDLSVRLGVDRAQAEKEARNEWQEAARKAFLAQDCRKLSLTDLEHIASGKKLRLRAPERNATLYRILTAHGSPKFHKLFPTEESALVWATAVHAKHSSDGRDATKDLADLFLSDGMDDAVSEGLVEVILTESFEVYELTREMENDNGTNF